MKPCQIRIASPADAEACLHIYTPYVEKTAISFEYTAPSLTEFRTRITETLRKYPYLVAVRDGEIVGYAYAGAFKSRYGYRFAAESSIYVKDGLQKSGIGKALYTALETLLARQNLLTVYAAIADTDDRADPYLTKNSIDFHAHLGYRPVASFPNCGYKFGRWYHLLWMEKPIGEKGEIPRERIPFPLLPPIEDFFISQESPIDN